MITLVELVPNGTMMRNLAAFDWSASQVMKSNLLPRPTAAAVGTKRPIYFGGGA